MMFTFSVGDMRFSAAGAILGGGLSELIEINETAATLVLTKRIEEVERVTLHPRGGEIEEIRL